MARTEDSSPNFGRSVRRLLFGLVLALLVALVVFWRMDGPRAEHLRIRVVDYVVPGMDWLLLPVARLSQMVEDFQSYAQLYEQNQELRRELQQMKAWRETAIQLDQRNARLLDLNNVRLNPKHSIITAEVLTDSGSPFHRSLLINIGSNDNVRDGWAAMDGFGLVGRISGVGRNSSRIILLTDRNSRIPVTILPAERRSILNGDNTRLPPLTFLEDSRNIKAGDRVVTSGDGKVFPPGLPVGQVIVDAAGVLRVKPAADFQRLDFLRIIRHFPAPPIADTGSLVAGVEEPREAPGGSSAE